MLLVRTVDVEVRAARDLSEISQLYAAFPHLVVAGCDLMGTDRLEGRLCPNPIHSAGYGVRRAPF